MSVRVAAPVPVTADTFSHCVLPVGDTVTVHCGGLLDVDPPANFRSRMAGADTSPADIVTACDETDIVAGVTAGPVKVVVRLAVTGVPSSAYPPIE